MGYLLTFSTLRAVNAQRARRWHEGFPDAIDEPSDWTGADWSNAAAGEMGEAANVVKKLRRLETGIRQAEQGSEPDDAYRAMLLQKLAKEIGDTVIYLDLLATFYGLQMEDCVTGAFNGVSVREQFPERLPT